MKTYLAVFLISAIGIFSFLKYKEHQKKHLLLNPGILAKKTVEVDPPTVISPEEPAFRPRPVQDEKELKVLHKKLNLEFISPPDVYFSLFNLDSDIVTVSGQDQAKSREIFILSTDNTPPFEEVIRFINTLKKGVSLLEGKDLEVTGEVKEFALPMGTGLKTLKIIPSGVRGQRVLTSIQMERLDGKGSYFIIVKAMPSYFSEAGPFRRFIKTFKAL